MLTPDEFDDLINEIDMEASTIGSSYEYGKPRSDQYLVSCKDKAKMAYFRVYKELEVYEVAFRKQRNA